MTSQDDLITSFKSHLRTNLPKAPSFHPYYEEALAYMLLGGGKHFRAQLLLGVVEALSPQKLAASMDAALALECMHTYSLIHDDLPAMDNASLRRGLETLHKKYDELTAILVGDALNTHAFTLLSRLEFDALTRIKLVEYLSVNAGTCGMVLGQILDCHFEKQRLDIEKLEFLHLHKTGCLIAASLAMGAIIAGFDEKPLYEFGLKLGLIFQINDDIIDETLSSKEAGKPTKADTFKNSFVNLYGLEAAKEVKENKKLQLEKDLHELDPNLACFLSKLINKYL